MKAYLFIRLERVGQDVDKMPSTLALWRTRPRRHGTWWTTPASHLPGDAKAAPMASLRVDSGHRISDLYGAGTGQRSSPMLRSHDAAVNYWVCGPCCFGSCGGRDERLPL